MIRETFFFKNLAENGAGRLVSDQFLFFNSFMTEAVIIQKPVH